MLINNHKQLSGQILQKLIYEIKSGQYAHLDRLPPEVVLAENLGISRNLLRDCLGALEREGFISRKQGIGTLINKHVLNVPVRIDLEEEFLKMIEKAGYKGKTAFVDISKIEADEEVAAKLNIQVGDAIYKTERLILADEKPAIFSRDCIPVSLIQAEYYDEEDLKKPIFYFLEYACHETVDMDLSQIKIVLSDEKLSGVLQVGLSTPLLFLDEVGYNFYGKPLIHSKEYYVDGIIEHTVLRKKI